MLDASFPGVTIDPILAILEDTSLHPGYADPRHCLVFWARPPGKIQNLIGDIQEKLRAVAPSKKYLDAKAKIYS